MERSTMTTLYIGLSDADSHLQKIDKYTAVHQIAQLLVSLDIAGGTISEASGFYTHEDGTIVFENSLRVELLNIETDLVQRISSQLAQLFNQESILACSTDSVKSAFIGRN